MKIFQREQRSLFGEILDWMLTPLLLLWPVSLALTWLVAQGLANKPFDRALEYNAHALAQLVTVQNGRVLFNLPQPASEILRADESDIIYYQVLGPKGELLSGERELPLPPPPEERSFSGDVRLRDAELRGIDIRVAYIWVRVPLPGAPAALVQVAETRSKRSVLATEIIKGVMLPQFVILPLAVLLVWLALVRGIKPLRQLEERIRARKSDDLSPLDHKAVPMEVAPLVDSVNDLLQRLQESMATQKRFLADAAHQLKTPLAGLRMQADLAQREGTSTEELKKSLQQIGRSSIRATHTVNQLLALARAEGGAAVVQRQKIDLARLVIDVVQDSVPRAMDKHIDLGYDGADPGTPGVGMEGNPTLLKELVRNLVDNAINYTPSGGGQPGMVTVRVLPETFAHVVLFQVEDSGPGVPESERELVFQPFYRALGNEADGSGLGLPIVREIARQHGADVELEDARPGSAMPGARFTVRFTASNGGG
ncbi:MAG: sensor histidine kinase N-terminal domain-containing protein [Alicycliphilus sp.]|nr:sensor histidine kinase N-terminal domain-containing protein [Alicycliphilus sp.]MCA0440089.1 sensor histidine kinase N-terminal domain-containing protein [Pseudomonadota bacterium]MBP7326827.1 sensor histidine kinase N-terminal domain-containing protein [Alicycliphilus sp.]MBP7327880.1 sensor histidine kinase N-terminal domain-containing protein [Alicycliphilus sp.]MBP8137862.1 sensor histidine kinase N-terminal domain-containing protein [Alicycliphilus sp.]